jgi:WD40 repeat protein
VVVVDLETGLTRYRFETSKAQVCSLAFSRDTRNLAVGTGYIESRIHLWSLDSGRETSVFEGHSGWVSGLRFLSDGRTLLSTSQDETIRVWDLPTRTSTKVYRGHQKEIWSHALSPDEKTLITGSKDGEVRVWDLRGEPLSTPYHRVRPELMPWQWSLGEGGRDLWLLSTNRMVCRVHGPGFQEVEWHPEFGTNLVSMMVAPDASRMVVATQQGELRWHRLKDGVLLSRPRPMDEPVSVVVHPGGNLFTMGHVSSKYALWGGDSTKPLIQGVFSELASYSDWVGNGSSMMSLNQDGTYFLHDFAADRVRTGQFDLRETFGFAHSPDGRWLAVSSDRGEVKLMDSQDHRLKARLGGFKGAVRGLVFSPDNGRLVTGGGGTETLRFWEMESEQMVLELSSDVGFLTQIRFTSDGNTVVAQGGTGELMVWTAPSWEEIRWKEALATSGSTHDTNQSK